MGWHCRSISLVFATVALVGGCEKDEKNDDGAGETGAETGADLGGTEAAEGEACAQDAHCADPLICSVEVCAQPECEVSADCPTDWTCSGGRCQEPFWAVGDGGLVVRAGTDGSAQTHPVETAVDLQAIACYGSSLAWAVGPGGTMIATSNGGASFETVALPSQADLYAVSVGHGGTVAAGGAGVVLVAGPGQAFVEHGDIAGTVRGIAVRPDGAVAVGDAGLRWALRGTTEEQSKIAGVDLLDVDGSHGDVVVAVGRQGTVLWSANGGESFEAVVSHVAHDLWAVQVAGNEQEALAVGDNGTALHITAQGVQAAVAPPVDLRALHIGETGLGTAVGMGGVVLLTSDFGVTFEPLLTLATHLRGVDAIGGTHW